MQEQLDVAGDLCGYNITSHRRRCGGVPGEINDNTPRATSPFRLSLSSSLYHFLTGLWSVRGPKSTVN